MITPRQDVKILIYTQPVDFRKAINGLSAIVYDEFSDSLTSGDIFVFHNSNKNKVKLLWWDRNGFVLYCKNMAKGTFVFSKMVDGNTIQINNEQLMGLLAGIDFQLMVDFPEINYRFCY